MDKDDIEFLEAFERCTLSKKCWDHSAHVRMAWLQMERAASFEQALRRIKDGIRRLNASLGTVAYHETVTIAFARLINYRRQLDGAGLNWRCFQIEHEDILSRQRPVLRQFYSAAALDSAAARAIFQEPDIKPLPAPGVLRAAVESDVAAMLAIYKPYVEATPVSFEVVPPSEPEFCDRMRKIIAVAPWLVYCIDDRIAGFAYAFRHHEREAYKWSADLSIYLDSRYRRLGVGRVLYANLLRLLKEQGYFNAYAGITLPNPGSVGLHESMGFSHIGTFRSVGFKLNRWHDVGWWQKTLQNCDSAPPPLKSPAALVWQ